MLRRHWENIVAWLVLFLAAYGLGNIVARICLFFIH